MMTDGQIRILAEAALQKAEGGNINLWPVPVNQDERKYWIEVWEAGFKEAINNDWNKWISELKNGV